MSLTDRIRSAQPAFEGPVPTHTPIDMLLQDRGSKYGDYATMSSVAQSIKQAIQTGPGWAALRPYQKESLDMIATKIARVVCGDPMLLDSWVDIEGYARKAREHVEQAVGGATA